MKQVSFCFLVCALILLSSPLYATIRLISPESADRGSAFVARAISDEPVDKFTFFWRDKVYHAKAEQDEAGRWQARILLPVALSEKRSAIELGAGRKNSPEMRKKVAITDIKRPVQKLVVDRKYVDPPASVKARIAADREKVRKALQGQIEGRSWDVPFERPVPGTVSSQFGLKRVFNGQPRGEHKGLDLRGAQGTPIKACADGVVALVDDLYYSGNTVYLNHGEGVFSAYLHMSKPLVKPGETVKRGQVIGLVGATGRVTGPHLHLSVLAQGQSVDPLPLLESRQEERKKNE